MNSEYLHKVELKGTAETVSSQCIRFLHIPKTAGSTRGLIFRKQFGKRATFCFSGDIKGDVIRFQSFSDRRKDQIVFFHGHAPLFTGLLKADSARAFTMLRDPIERLKSFFQHVYEGKSPYIDDTFLGKTFNLDRFLDSQNPELSNLQAKMLINSHSCESADIIDSISPSQAVDMALDGLLNKLCGYGLQEFFDESLSRLSKILDFRLTTYVSKNKKNAKKLVQFEDKHIEKIMMLNTIDIELYRVAKENFVSRINQFSKRHSV